METKHRLIEVLNNIDTHDAREAVRLFHSKWIFKFRPAGDPDWSASPSYSFSGFMDTDEAARNSADMINDLKDDFYAAAEMEVHLTNHDLQVDRMFVVVFGESEGRVIKAGVPSPENAPDC